MNTPADGTTAIDAEAYWDARYRGISGRSGGRPGAAAHRYVTPLVPGSALELGCGRGDETVWLAGMGWSVVAVDVSGVALDYAAANAARVGVADRIAFEKHDLARSFPTGLYDLVTAIHLAAFPRARIFRRAAAAVGAGGHLLIVDPVKPGPDTEPIKVAGGQYPVLEETLESLELRDRAWARLWVGAVERSPGHSGGTKHALVDNVIPLRRL